MCTILYVACCISSVVRGTCGLLEKTYGQLHRTVLYGHYIIKVCMSDKGIYTLTEMNNLGMFNPLNPELNPICYLLSLLAHHFLHVSMIRVKSLTIRLLMSYIYGAPILDVSRSHTTTQHSR